MSEFLVTADDIVKQEHENDLLDAKYEVNVLEDIIKTEDICSEDDQFQCENVTANSVLLKKEQENVLLDTKYEISYFEDDIKREDVCAEDNDIVKLESSSSESVTPNTDVLKKEQEDDLMDDEYEISSLEDNIKTEDLCSEDEKFQLDNESVKLESSSSESDKHKGLTQPKPRKQYNKPLFRCDKCAQTTVLPSTKFIRHCVRVHDMKPEEIKPYVCELCSARFQNSSCLARHVKYHNAVRSVICSYCEKGFVTKHDLNIHQKQHLNRREFGCDECGKCFNRNKDLKTHKLMVHTDPGQWKYVCEFCNKPFPIKSSYESHVITHAGDRRFECYLCQKRFLDKRAVKRHIATHTKVKQFKCRCCEKEYKEKRGLKVHMVRLHGIGVGEVKLRPNELKFMSQGKHVKSKQTP